MLTAVENGPFEELLREFNKHDPSSMETRYPFKKDFATPTLPDLDEVNFKALRESIGRMLAEIGSLYHKLQYVNEPWWDEGDDTF